ncbi:MAG: Sir2 silent information regulator family NAD-dependent deacetylase [Lachnospiraceae bacterium]|nr:Sir2 silent information regulator family NAD-dependent deacetylase [Lachnospiraceae bacterium]
MNSNLTFQRFLSGRPAADYIFQDRPYEEQIAQAAELIKEADYVLYGLGAGMSTAAGAQYGGSFFEENFSEFQEKYGKGLYMRDMYSAGFYPFPDEESFWGYWSKQCMLAGVKLDVTPLYRMLIQLADGKKGFCISTNVDGQMIKAGWPEDKIFCTQGDYFHIQCQKKCHEKVYDGTKMFQQMDQARKDCKVPSYMVPKCPVCGGPMGMNLRCDEYFVEDENWHLAEGRFGEFLSEAYASGKKIVLMCLGVGFNTPTIIRYPFEKMVRENKQCSLIRLNLTEAVIQKSYQDREVGINESIAKSIPDILNVVKTKK